jgi:hypothetical protein
MKFLKGLNPGSLAIGAGIILLAPIVIPIIGAVLKPVAKSLIKGGLIAYESAKVSLAETKETFEDLAAEAKAEMAQPPAQEQSS